MKLWMNSMLRKSILILVLLSVSSTVYAAAKPIRALHIVVFNLTVSDAKRLIDDASNSGFNTLVLGMPWLNGLKLLSTPWITPKKLTWSRDDLLDVVEYARQKNLEVVPQLTLLSHQETLGLANSFPSLMFNSHTYDPSKPKVYELIYPIIDEVIELIHPKAIHIGHDEVVGWDDEHFKAGILKSGEHQLPPDLFLADVNKLHDYLTKKNVETWMWGDMLISPDEFPSMINRADLNGSTLGYGRDLRSKIPKDIVICDWHYNQNSRTEFPTLGAFNAEGFNVIGATWRDKVTTQNFSRYAAKVSANGMMASTWIVFGESKNIKNVINNWDEVEGLIRDSGEAFSKDFPDAK